MWLWWRTYDFQKEQKWLTRWINSLKNKSCAEWLKLLKWPLQREHKEKISLRDDDDDDDDDDVTTVQGQTEYYANELSLNAKLRVFAVNCSLLYDDDDDDDDDVTAVQGQTEYYANELSLNAKLRVFAVNCSLLYGGHNTVHAQLHVKSKRGQYYICIIVIIIIIRKIEMYNFTSDFRYR